MVLLIEYDAIWKATQKYNWEFNKLPDTHLSLSLASLFLWIFFVYFTLSLVLNDTKVQKKLVVRYEVPAEFISA